MTRRVYTSAGKLLSSATWYSSYRAETEGRPRRDEAARAPAREAEDAPGGHDADADDHRADDDRSGHDRSVHDDAVADDAYADDDRRRHDGGCDDDARADDSAVAIAPTSHDGIRVGRSVRASTVACAVQPSAITVPARSTAYS